MTRTSLRLVPILSIGASTAALGTGWVLSPEPWLLDRRANEELLQLGYDELLAAQVNAHLDDYLSALYRFFGWWLVAVGALVVAYAVATRLATPAQRAIIHATLGVVVLGTYVMQLRFIPDSPFVWTSYALALTLAASAVTSRWSRAHPAG